MPLPRAVNYSSRPRHHTRAHGRARAPFAIKQAVNGRIPAASFGPVVHAVHATPLKPPCVAAPVISATTSSTADFASQDAARVLFCRKNTGSVLGAPSPGNNGNGPGALTRAGLGTRTAHAGRPLTQAGQMGIVIATRDGARSRGHSTDGG